MKKENDEPEQILYYDSNTKEYDEVFEEELIIPGEEEISLLNQGY